MMNLNLNLNLNLNDSELLCEDAVLHPMQEPEGVAIIGMDVKAGSATSKEAVWQAFRDGLDMITELPEERLSDAVNFAKIAYGKDVEAFSQRAYLPRIDTFEPELFKLSRREAELMDPVQRLFLESAWCALEDAGYGGGRLVGSKTGVFVGFNQVGDSYESLLQDVPEEMLGIKLSGNTTSFLASRISYLLDLKGPAIVIDTACSSSLVALHEACEAIKGKEIDTAIVGSIRIFFCPERTGENIGTTSTTERTRSFDGSADGTGGGEGVINLILKPLRAAVRDRDHVYGVIKGSCANQDGSSIGITAPNSAAQEQCILEAWEKASVHPDQISYIEAHGTATRLGDPVEIGGLTGAFSHFTRKKQFCALGAAKSNFGHLDCCSGLLGVVKLLLMMEHQMIPPSLHFTYPNAKIDYVDSPIFMNDTLRPWESEDGVLTAGVSSFGLSGTNCHVILQSYPNSSLPCTLAFRRQILTVSARTKESLKRYLLTLQDFLKERNDVRLEDLCYSLNVGRTKHVCRFAMVISSISEFLNLREEELLSSVYYGQYRLVSEETDEEGFLSVSNKNKLTALASDAVISMDVDTLAKVYLRGADVDFAPLYENATVKMISLPSYAFSKVRCWHESKALTQIPAAKETSLHPLLDRCATQSFGIRIYEKRVSLDSCMELREHRINGVCVLPGTAYVEMICEIGKQFYGAKSFRFDSVMFFSLLTCEKGETKLLHCVVREDADKLCIDIASREANGQWTRHAEGVLSPCKSDVHPKTDLGAFLSAYTRVSSEEEREEQSFVRLGEHWHTGIELYAGENSVVLFSKVPEAFRKEAMTYTLYPPLLDGSMNSGIYLLDGLYLPLHYKNMQFFAPLRGDVYSRITRLKDKEQGSEIALFHVELLASDGSLIGEVEEYSLKRVNDGEQLLNNQDQLLPLYEITWTPLDGTIERQTEEIPSAAVLIYSHAQARSPMIQACEKRFQRVIHFIVDGETETSYPNYTYIKNCEKDIREALQTLGDLRTYLFVNLIGFSPDSEDLDQGIETKLGFNFRWIKSLSFFPGRKQLRFLTMNATRVDGSEVSYNALNQALIGLCSCVESEQSDIDLSIVDTDDCSALQTVAETICQPSGQFVTAIRNNRIYLEQLSPGVTSSNPIEICNDQVILITGGYGGIGLAVAEEIFQMASAAKVVLLNRNAHKGGPYEERVKKLISQGFHIRILQADVTNEISLAAVLQQIREEYGKISGVIHAAGIAGDGMLVHKEWSSVLKVLLPKIRGAVLLDSLTCEDSLEFMLLFSSFTSAVGAPGQTDYAAANAFLDAFTYERNRMGRRTLTVNWTGWKESGMAVNYNVNWQESFAHFVTDQEGRAYFRKLLDKGTPRMIACSFPDGLPSELSRRFLLPTPKAKEETDMVIETASEVDMPVIYGKSPDKLTDFEKNIALAWARTLRVTEVNLYDKFFEAGGNSLLASYLQKEINRIYPDAMAITDVFVYSTIADIAAYIAGKQEPPMRAENIPISEEGNIEDLVQKFVNGEISLEDIEKLV